jgi:hypothetical protein
MKIIYSPVTSFHLGPNILLNTLLSNTLSLSSCVNVCDQVSQPYKITGEVIIRCILIYKFLESRLEDKIFSTEWQQALPDSNLLSISSWIEFLFVRIVPKYLKYSTISKELSVDHIVTSSCILISRHDYVLSFISIHL